MKLEIDIPDLMMQDIPMWMWWVLAVFLNWCMFVLVGRVIYRKMRLGNPADNANEDRCVAIFFGMVWPVTIVLYVGYCIVLRWFSVISWFVVVNNDVKKVSTTLPVLEAFRR